MVKILLSKEKIDFLFILEKINFDKNLINDEIIKNDLIKLFNYFINSKIKIFSYQQKYFQGPDKKIYYCKNKNKYFDIILENDLIPKELLEKISEKNQIIFDRIFEKDEKILDKYIYFSKFSYRNKIKEKIDGKDEMDERDEKEKIISDHIYCLLFHNKLKKISLINKNFLIINEYRIIKFLEKFKLNKNYYFPYMENNNKIIILFIISYYNVNISENTLNHFHYYIDDYINDYINNYINNYNHSYNHIFITYNFDKINNFEKLNIFEKIKIYLNIFNFNVKPINDFLNEYHFIINYQNIFAAHFQKNSFLFKELNLENKKNLYDARIWRIVDKFIQ